MNDANGKSKAKPDIFSHHDHVSFLREYFDYLKSLDKHFSLRKLAQSTGLAVGYLPMVMSGQRPLSTNALSKLIPHLKLSEREIKVLESLHTIGTTDDPRRRIQAINQLSRLAEFSKKNKKEVEVYRYLTKWFYVAIREMVFLHDFTHDLAWIQARLARKISLSECEEALSFLTENGFIQKTKEGQYQVTEKHLDCRDGIFRASLGEFHRQMFDLAAQSIETVARDKRYIMGHTFSFDTEDLAKVRDIVNEAIEKITQIGHAAKTKSEVYQIQVATFPLTLKEEATEVEK